MSGLQFKIDQEFVYGLDVKGDQRLNDGSLILLEPARDGIAGIPTSLNNYAHDSALELVGQSIDKISIKNNLASAGGIAERTTKGGLHGIVPQNPATGTPRISMSGRIPAALEAYFLANTDHSYYIALQATVTRNVSSLYPEDSIVIAGIYSSSIGSDESQQTPLVYQNKSSLNVTGGRVNASGLLGRSYATPQPAFLVDSAMSSLIIHSATIDDSIRRDLFCMGQSSLNYQKGMPSWVLYSLYIEDLTVSGQTYAQAHAKSQAVYDSRFGNGGIYANDSWTTPT